MEKSTATFHLARCGILSAIAILLFYMEIPMVPPYKLDISTLPAILAGFSMGPVSGMVVILIKDLVHALSTSSGMVGELADLIMSWAYVVPASLIYRARKNKKCAVIAMAVGTLAMTVSAVFVNRYILFPLYGMNDSAVVALGQSVIPSIKTSTQFLLFITAPFNLLKGTVLSVVSLLLYKRVSPLLHKNT